MDNTTNVTMPVERYTQLLTAEIGIRMIAESFGKYGADDTVVRVACNQCGYALKEDDADA